jgi:agmatinase
MSIESSSPPPGFGGLPEEYRDPKTSAIAVIPVPYDLTSSWKKGADKGPQAIIDASANMELFDIATRTEVAQRGIVTTEPIRCDGPPEELAELVEKAVHGELLRKRLPVVLGGEHSVSIGAFRAAAAKYGSSLSILQIDAHGDTRESYLGSPCNHACVMARARELCPITQVGIRAIDAEEIAGMDEDRVFWAHEITSRAERYWIDRAIEQQNENVYVTIDLDAFDPAFVPATGTPEPGGLSWNDANALIEALSAKRNVVGFDVVELLPHEAHWASAFFAAKLVYRFLSVVFARR